MVTQHNCRTVLERKSWEGVRGEMDEEIQVQAITSRQARLIDVAMVDVGHAVGVESRIC